MKRATDAQVTRSHVLESDFTPARVIVKALRMLRAAFRREPLEQDYEADPLANPSAYSPEEVAAAYARYVCPRCNDLLDVLRICADCARREVHVPWADVPHCALVLVEEGGRRDYFYRVGLVGWWVGGGTMSGELKFVDIPPPGNCWPAWSSWPFTHARVVALDLYGDENADQIRQLADPAGMSMLDAIRCCLATGDALRPANYPKGHYFFISHDGRLCLPGLTGAAPTDVAVAVMMGPWVTLPMAAVERERAALLEEPL